MTLTLLLFIIPNLPRTTERPVRERGDECSELPASPVPQSDGRKSVVRGLLLTSGEYGHTLSRVWP